MALGVDQWAAQICIELNIPFTAAVPCDGQDSMWPRASKDAYHALLEKAEYIQLVSPGPYAAWKMHVRNQWMVDNSDGLIAVWNGDMQGGTANCVKYAMDQGKKIYRIHPYAN